MYTVSSRWVKAWLSEASTAQQYSEQNEFLMDAPSPPSLPTSSSPTITVASLKSTITEVENWLAENGGSEDQRTCIEDTLTF